jgi:hypothetical protein
VFHGGSRARLDDTNDRNRQLRPEGRQRVRGCRVAGDYERFNLLREEISGNLPAVSQNRFRTFGAVRKSGGIAKVDNTFMRKPANQLRNHRQPADTGVEDANWFFAIAYHEIFPTMAAPRGRASIRN